MSGWRRLEKLQVDPTLTYALLAVPAMILLCFLISPFGSPDEHKHFERIVAITEGHIVPSIGYDGKIYRKDPRVAGSEMDEQVKLVADEVDYGRSAVDPKFKMNISMLELASKRYESGNHLFVEHSNTALYPPLMYAPALTAITVARLVGLPVLIWMYLGRLANALASAVMIFIFARINRASSSLVFCAACFPTVLFQSASLSTDAIVLPLFIGYATLISMLVDSGALTRIQNALLIGTTIALSVGKVAYVPLAFLPFVIVALRSRKIDNQTILYGAVAIISVALWATWAWLVHGKVFSMRPDVYVSPIAQLRFILNHPISFLALLYRNIREQGLELAFDAAGNKLGYSTIFIKRTFCAALVVAFLCVSMTRKRVKSGRSKGQAYMVTLTIGASCILLTYLLIYLQFNPVGAANIEGIQGRYLTPIAILAGITLPLRLKVSGLEKIGANVSSMMTIAAPLITVFYVLRRYWM